MDDLERRRWQDPEAILAGIGVRKGSTVMDIGCGHGFFTIPAARLVGASGRVYGIDISDVAITQIAKKASAEGLGNLTLAVGRAEDAVFCEACADVVFFGIVLHDFEEPEKVLSNAERMLKPRGRLANLDWKKESMAFGPPLEKRFDEARATALIESAGLVVEATAGTGPYHYMITARRKQRS